LHKRACKNDHCLHHFLSKSDVLTIEENLIHVTFEVKIQYRVTKLIGSLGFYPDDRKSLAWFLKEI